MGIDGEEISWRKLSTACQVMGRGASEDAGSCDKARYAIIKVRCGGGRSRRTARSHQRRDSSSSYSSQANAPHSVSRRRKTSRHACTFREGGRTSFGCRPKKREATYLQKQVHPHACYMNFCSILLDSREFGKGVRSVGCASFAGRILA